MATTAVTEPEDVPPLQRLRTAVAQVSESRARPALLLVAASFLVALAPVPWGSLGAAIITAVAWESSRRRQT